MNDRQRAPANDGLVARYALPPDEIEARSLSIVEKAIESSFADEQERFVATRIVYASGDTSLADLIRISPGAIATGIEALRRGAAIVGDVRMVMSGIDEGRARSLGCTLHCAIDDPEAGARARAGHLPRAVEAMRSLSEPLHGGIAVIGNAPTALLSVLDLIDSGVARPSFVIGMPVGFVAASEAKRELIKRDVPYITIAGTRGGSPLAVATINALLRLAESVRSAPDRSRTAVLYAGHGSRARGAAEAMEAAMERVRQRGIFGIVEIGFLELCQPDIPEGLRRCVEQGAKQVIVVPYFLHQGVHIRRDIPALLRQEADRYPGLRVTLAPPIGLHADLADVMLSGGLDAEPLPDIREIELEAVVTGPSENDDDD